jgi:hypothetical protein
MGASSCPNPNVRPQTTNRLEPIAQKTAANFGRRVRNRCWSPATELATDMGPTTSPGLSMSTNPKHKPMPRANGVFATAVALSPARFIAAPSCCSIGCTALRWRRSSSSACSIALHPNGSIVIVGPAQARREHFRARSKKPEQDDGTSVGGNGRKPRVRGGLMHPGLPRLRRSISRRLDAIALVGRFTHEDRALTAFEHAQVRKPAGARRSAGQVHWPTAVRTQRENYGGLAAKLRKLCRQHHRTAPFGHRFYQTAG